MERTTVVLVTLVAYKILLLGIGLWAQRRTRNTEDYFLGGQQLGPFVAAISYAASSSSAWTLLGVSGAAFSLGLGAFWLLPGIVAAHIVCWFWVAPRLQARTAGGAALTLTDVLAGDAHGPWRGALAVSASLIVLFCFVFYVAAQFQGAGNTFTSNFDMDGNHALWLGAAIVLVYTLLGGFWAVSVTDALQGLLMCIAAVLLPVAAVLAVGGPATLLAALPEMTPGLGGGFAATAAIGFAAGMMLVGLGTFGQPQLLNRFMALRDEKSLRQARVMSVGWFVVVLVGMLTLGWCGRLLMPDAPNGETLFFDLTNSLFPVLIGGVITAAVLSAIMSTADSQLLVAAAAVAHDMGLSRRWPNHSLLVSRLVMALLCAGAALLASALPDSIFSRVLFAWNGLGSAFGPLLIIMLAGRTVAPPWALASMLTGFGLTAVIFSLPNTPGDIAERVVPFIAALVLALVGTRNRRAAAAAAPATTVRG
ncbi:MAG: sodium/proline symporter [Pseudomonadota bacterium]